MADNITVPKTYFETLLRRAEFHGSEGLIKIPVADYGVLVQDAYRFQCLTAALIAGGASEETLEVLISSQHNLPKKSHDHDVETSRTAQRMDWSEETYEEDSLTEFGTQNFGMSRYEQRKFFQSTSPSTPASTVHQEEGVKISRFLETPRFCVDTHGDRSLVLTDMPSSTSIADLTCVVRGGSISNIYIRRQTRTAHVSFVLPEAAKHFHTFSRHHRITVKGKVVQVAWDRQQAYLSGYLINQILHHGATRNLVIRFIGPAISATSIREDLDHIHRLEVVKVEFKGGHAWIELNSIQHAVTAKNCMQSRLKYKKLRIDYFSDGCDSPLASIDALKRPRQSRNAVVDTGTNKPANRFATLSIGTYEGASESGSEIV